jgi:hypothetical protein
MHCLHILLPEMMAHEEKSPSSFAKLATRTQGSVVKPVLGLGDAADGCDGDGVIAAAEQPYVSNHVSRNVMMSVCFPVYMVMMMVIPCQSRGRCLCDVCLCFL